MQASTEGKGIRRNKCVMACCLCLENELDSVIRLLVGVAKNKHCTLTVYVLLSLHVTCVQVMIVQGLAYYGWGLNTFTYVCVHGSQTALSTN